MERINKKVFSWTAVFVGALVGLGINFLLNLLSLAIGISIFSQQQSDKITVSIFGAILFALVAILAMFITGWVAGKLTILQSVRKRWGLLYGFTAWCISFIMTVILLMNTIQFTQFHSNFTSKQLTSVKITNQSPMLTETQSGNSETDKKIISLNAFVTFIFFLTGACASTVGGYIGFSEDKHQGKYNL